MNQTSTKSVVESGILTALMIVFAMIGLSVPMLGFFGSIFVPMTIAIVGVRHGFSLEPIICCISDYSHCLFY